MKKFLYGDQTSQTKMQFLLQDLKERGLFSFIQAHAQKKILDPLSKIVFDQTVARRSFCVDGKSYPYASFWYNFTWQNERAVEIPYFSEYISHFSPAKTLEVGNTLGHYYPVSHQIVDKYEAAPGVLNVDIVDFHPKKKYDLIIAISTLEHVGWHEKGHDAKKSLQAIAHLRSLLSPKGKLVFSIPFGINPMLDSAISKNTLPLSTRTFLRRKNRWNEWEECDVEVVRNARYNSPYPSANAVLIGEMNTA